MHTSIHLPGTHDPCRCPAILAAARERGCQLIVMSTHGRSSVRKQLFGATAERVLRETTVPVLLAPADPGALPFEDLATSHADAGAG